MEETIKFYINLGFEVVTSMPPEGSPDWVMMSMGDVTFMFQTFKSLKDELPEISREDGGSLLLYIQLDNIIDYYQNLKSKTKIYKELEKTFYDVFEFSIIDNNNYILTFAENEYI
jgi:hypothetical protein